MSRKGNRKSDDDDYARHRGNHVARSCGSHHNNMHGGAYEQEHACSPLKRKVAFFIDTRRTNRIGKLLNTCGDTKCHMNRRTCDADPNRPCKAAMQRNQTNNASKRGMHDEEHDDARRHHAIRQPCSRSRCHQTPCSIYAIVLFERGYGLSRRQAMRPRLRTLPLGTASSHTPHNVKESCPYACWENSSCIRRDPTILFFLALMKCSRILRGGAVW